MPDVPVLEELLTVVRGQDEQRAIEQIVVAERCDELLELTVEVKDLVVVEIDKVLQVAVADLYLRTVVVEHVGNRVEIAGSDKVVPVVRPGELPLMGGRRCVMTVGIHVMEVQKERFPHLSEELQRTRVDHRRIAPQAGLVEDIEAGAEAAIRVFLAGCRADDRARRYGDRVVAPGTQDFGDGRVLGGDSHLVFALDVEVECVARSEQRVDRGKGACGLRSSAFEDDRPGCEIVDKWCGRPLVPVEAHVIGAKRVDHDHNDVRRRWDRIGQRGLSASEPHGGHSAHGDQDENRSTHRGHLTRTDPRSSPPTNPTGCGKQGLSESSIISAPFASPQETQRRKIRKEIWRDEHIEPRSGEIWIAWGVSPRFPGLPETISRGAAADVRGGGLRLTPQPKICRPSGALFLFFVLNLGLTPQAKHLSRLRRSVQ